MPTPTVENYLKSIYHLQEENERVKTQELASDLDVSRSSVTNMLQSLGEDELVDYEPYKGAKLTENGVTSALQVIRHHRLIEIFLVKTLDFDWDEVHEEAERLEHAVSDKVAERIDEYLGYPKFDPHGDPIPTAEGDVYQPDAHPLHDIEATQHVHIERVLDQDPKVLQHFEEIGLTPNTTLEVTDVSPIDGQMSIVRDDDEEMSVSRELASKLLVTEIE